MAPKIFDIKCIIKYLYVLMVVSAMGCMGHVAVDRRDEARIEPPRDISAQNALETNPKMSVDIPKNIDPAFIANHPLTLEDAITYALSNNLDATVKQLESDIQKEAIAGAKLKMMPSLTIDGEISERDSPDASYSSPLFNEGGQDYNYSRDKTTKRISTELSWDLLNFGIAYYQQRQTAAQYEISEQRRRRVVQDLKLDVVKSFWQFLAAKRSMEMAKGVVSRLEQRDRILQKQLKAQTASELEALETSVILSELQMALSGLGNELRRHKSKLATLMGLPPNSDYDIVGEMFDPRLESARVDIGMLETQALAQRPELFEQASEERITKDEARIAIARSLPRPTLFYRFTYDDDSHLYSNQWQEAGLRLSFDLLSVPQQFNQRKQLAVKKTLVQTRRRAVAAAVVTQLRLAVIDFEEAKEKYRLLKTVTAKRAKLMDARQRHVVCGNGTYEVVLKEEAKYLISQLRTQSALAELMVSEQRILNSAGSDDIGNSVFLNSNRLSEMANTNSSARPPAAKVDADTKRAKQPERESPKAVTRETAASGEKNIVYRGIGDPLPYSIQLSSWSSLEEARAALSTCTRKGLNAFIVKTEVHNMGVRWRVFEGYYRTPAEAKTAKETNGLKKALVMKTPFAIHVDNLPTRQAMTDMLEELAGMGYSSYALLGMDTGYQVLTGAFDTEQKAEAQAKEMESKGLWAQIVRR